MAEVNGYSIYKIEIANQALFTVAADFVEFPDKSAVLMWTGVEMDFTTNSADFTNAVKFLQNFKAGDQVAIDTWLEEGNTNFGFTF